MKKDIDNQSIEFSIPAVEIGTSTYRHRLQREDAILQKEHPVNARTSAVDDRPKSNGKEPDPPELFTRAVQTSLNAVTEWPPRNVRLTITLDGTVTRCEVQSSPRLGVAGGTQTMIQRSPDVATAKELTGHTGLI